MVTSTPHTRTPRGRSHWGLPLGLCFAAGGVAVGHELLWSRRMLDLLGGSADSATVAFGTFVLGMAVGAGLAARLLSTRQRPSLLADAAACQIWFALTVLPVLFSIPLSDLLWPRLGIGVLTHPLGFAIRILLAAGLLLLPAVASGAFLPFVVAALCGSSRSHARLGAFYYGVNTLGGLAAIALLPLFLEPALGLAGCSAFLTCLNCLLAGGCLLLHRQLGSQGTNPPSPSPPGLLRQVLSLPCAAVAACRRRPDTGVAASRPALVRHLLPAFGTGALVLAAEMLAYHHVTQVAASSLHVTVIVLGAVLLGLGLGSVVAGWVRGSRQAVPASLLAVALLLALQPIWFCSLTGGLRPFPLHAGHLPYFWPALRLALLGLLPLFAATGVLFPLLFSAASAELADDRGDNWGRLLLINGLGCFAGALLAQYVLMPFLGPWRGMGALAALAAVVLIVLLTRRRHWIWLGIAFVLALWAVPRWPNYRRLPLACPPDPGLKERRVLCGRDGVALLLESPAGQRRILLNNTYGIGGSHSIRLDRMEMLLPMMLHPSPRRVAAIGVGAGFTAEAALLDPGLERLDAVEISPLVLNLARTGFPRDRGGLFSDPRSTVHLADGRIFLAAQSNAYDLIVGDLFVPWREGLGGLYSLEFCRSAYTALRPGGLYCQWIPLYQVREQELALIVTTFRASFPDAVVVRNSFAFRNPAIGLVGWKAGQLSTETVRQRCVAIQTAPEITSAFLRHPQGVFLHLIGPANALVPDSQPGPLNTLANARLGYLATAGIGVPDWQPVTLDRWRSRLAAVLDATANESDSPSYCGLQAAQHWLDAQSAVVANRSAAAHADVEAALRAMPPKVFDDPRFVWEDFLVDVGLPIPRNYRALLAAPQERQP